MAPQIEAQLAGELLALAVPLQGKESDLALRSSHVIAVALAQLGRTAEAQRIAPSDDDFEDNTLDEVWAATARRKLAFGKTAEAKLAATRIKNRQLKGGVWASFAFEALARDNQTEARAYLAQVVQADGATAGRDIRLAVLFARTGQIEAARRIFGRAQAALKRSEDVTAEEFADSDNLSWNQIIAAQIEAGLSADVPALVARTGEHSSNAFDQLLQAGQFAEARALISARKDPAERAGLKNDMAWALAASGRTNEARELLIATEKEGATKSSDALTLLSSALAWYTTGDKAQYERQMSRQGEPGINGMEAWEWTPLGSLVPRAQVKGPYLAQWDARLQAFAARALELSETRNPITASLAAPALRTLVEQTQQSGHDETVTALLAALDKWMMLMPPKSDDENDATVRQETRLFLAKEWQKRGQIASSQNWLQQFLSAPDKDYADRAAQLIEAGFVAQGRAYAVKHYQPPLEINPYAIAAAEVAALRDGNSEAQSFAQWSRRFPDQRTDLLAQFAHELVKSTIEQRTGEQFTLGTYQF